MAGIYDFTVADIGGKKVKLDRYKGKVMLVVNTASECGFTPQYQGLEKLYEKLHGKGLEVLGFPCNQFGEQEPGTNKDIATFCERNYGVTFPMFAKVVVKGEDICPLYRFLTSSETNPKFAGEIKWNFTKFLLGRDGRVLKRYAPVDKPASIAADIEAALAAA